MRNVCEVECVKSGVTRYKRKAEIFMVTRLATS